MAAVERVYMECMACTLMDLFLAHSFFYDGYSISTAIIRHRFLRLLHPQCIGPTPPPFQFQVGIPAHAARRPCRLPAPGYNAPDMAHRTTTLLR